MAGVRVDGYVVDGGDAGGLMARGNHGISPRGAHHPAFPDDSLLHDEPLLGRRRWRQPAPTRGTWRRRASTRSSRAAPSRCAATASA